MTLLDPHRERLEQASGLSPEVIETRGYYSVSSRDELKGLGFPRDIAKYLPGISIPVFGLKALEPGQRPEPSGLVLRPDTPYEFKDGRVAKYLNPAKQANELDVHPSMRDLLFDVDAPLAITEGIIKGDAAASVGLVTVALAGVDGWMRDGAPHPAWSLIPLKGRQVLLAYDSDITAKLAVRAALRRLTRYLG